jgi:hypothetical protein
MVVINGAMVPPLGRPPAVKVQDPDKKEKARIAERTIKFESIKGAKGKGLSVQLRAESLKSDQVDPKTGKSLGEMRRAKKPKGGRFGQGSVSVDIVAGEPTGSGGADCHAVIYVHASLKSRDSCTVGAVKETAEKLEDSLKKLGGKDCMAPEGEKK